MKINPHTEIGDTGIEIGNIVKTVYPVGSIFMSINNTNPSTLFGGTWERIAQGRTIVGVNENDTDFNIAQKIGGLKQHSHSNSMTGATSLTVDQIPSHNHTYDKSGGTTGQASGNTGSTTLTINQIPSHKHKIKYGSNASGGDGSGVKYSNSEGSTDAYMEEVGGGQGHTHTLNNHTHTISTSSTNTGAKGGSGSHSHTMSDTGLSPNLMPYLTCYIWLRTA